MNQIVNQIDPDDPTADKQSDTDSDEDSPGAENERPVEIGGQDGPEPTRYGDWESGSRCTDF